MAQDKRAFHARLERIEPRLFRATYRGEFNPETGSAPAEVDGPQVLPDMHLGTDAQEVKTWVEQMAAGLGYERVIWDELPN